MTSGSSCQCSTNWAKSTFSWPAWIFMTYIKSYSIDSRNDQSPKREVVHETKLTSEIFWPTHTRLAQSVRALEWWSRGHGFNPDWGQFWRIFCSSLCRDLSNNLTETCIMKNWMLLYVHLSNKNGALFITNYRTFQDGHEICFVGDEAFRELSQVDPNADKLLDEVCAIGLCV